MQFSNKSTRAIILQVNNTIESTSNTISRLHEFIKPCLNYILLQYPRILLAINQQLFRKITHFVSIKKILFK